MAPMWYNKTSSARSAYIKVSIWLVVFNLTSCSEDDSAPEQISLSPSIYAYGAYDSKAAFWENGKKFMLGENLSYVRAGAISEGDFYMVGYGGILSTGGDDIWDTHKFTYRFKTWKNGEEVELIDEPNGMLSGIAVVDEHVYIAGVVKTNGREVAKFWENSEATVLSDSQYVHATATAIAVVGSEVHVVGSEATPLANIPRWWKNGRIQSFSSTSQDCTFTDVTISGTDVYITGFCFPGPTARYWKNGVEVNLSIDDASSQAFAIVVSGEDVFVAGHYAYNAGYWKNSSFVWGNQDYDGPSYAKDILVLNEDVYVSGENYRNNFHFEGSYLWKNNIVVEPFNGKDSLTRLYGFVITKPRE